MAGRVASRPLSGETVFAPRRPRVYEPPPASAHGGPPLFLDRPAPPAVPSFAASESEGDARWEESELQPPYPSDQVEKEVATELHPVERVEPQASPSKTLAGEASSDQIHVLGNDVQGKYIAHALAGRNYLPPVRLIVHKRAMQQMWEAAGRSIDLLRDGRHIVNDRAVPELAVHHRLCSNRPLPGESDEPIDHLIVTVPSSSVIRAFAAIKHRVDEQTTVCLVQDGLGLVEALNEAYFPDPQSRPSYVLAHMTHQLLPVEGRPFSVRELKQGRLYLTALPRDLGQTQIRYHPPVERLLRPSHLLRLLTTTPGLHAGGFSLDRFLRFKLSSVVFKSVVDPLTVVLDCTYDKLVGNAYATQLMDQLLGEIVNVIMRLPEFRDSPRRDEFRGAGFRKEIFSRLARKGRSDSRMRSLTERGWEGDIDFLNGYFIKRGREVGVRCPANETVLWMVKSKHAAQLAERRREVAFEGW
ncbi:hypothetical protein VTK73DRAFT_10282 [Phialemonium thermophilum]|uniref:2-dehydropantoate 2-reductase n=1 Tax=Phialemonium thermophilum TaxID=223376 RepID=A0ABR3XHL5_9PEZI